MLLTSRVPQLIAYQAYPPRPGGGRAWRAALKQALDAYGFDVVFGGARRDEEKGRAKERIFSFFRGQHPVGIRRPSGQVLV